MFKTPTNILKLAQNIYDEGFSVNPNDLIIESHVLNILSDIIKLLKVDNSQLNKSKTTLLGKDKRLIKTAQELILSDIVHTWSINEISRKVGLNSKKLKSGFKSEFGIPVYSFLQQERLKLALELLQLGNLSVTEISLTVGYANPSHFAYLFKRQFGNSPLKVKHDASANYKI
ncbi:MAG: helix-turn-helix transcriptional regulator [Rhizobiales bacterium]|nr:helix-turn-helix transcriptional regulator [Hyphomicrobiales bacterium]